MAVLFVDINMEKDKAFKQRLAKIFLENGAKTITMDDVAKEFGVSKKTLYVSYKNKDAMLEDVMDYFLETIIQRMKSLDNTIENAIIRMFSRDAQIERLSTTNNSIFTKQLVKYYPDLFNRYMLIFAKRFSEVLTHNIERGRRQGFYREDFDALAYAHMFFQLIMSYDKSPFFDHRQTHHKEVLMFYMNAITNEKGKQFMKDNDLTVEMKSV